MTPKLSIISAVKDGLVFLKQTAPTIQNQSFKDWEWIVIDDESEDPIKDYLESLRDSRIRVMRNSINLGQTKSLNIGLKLAKADWIVRQDGDDLARLKRLDKIMEATSNPKAELIFSDYSVIEQDGSPVSEIRFQTPIGPDFFSYLQGKNNPICHSSVAFRFAGNHQRLYNEDLNSTEDLDLWRRILNRSPQGLIHIPEILTDYRLVEDSKCGLLSTEQRAELLGKPDTRSSNGDSLSPQQLKAAVHAHRSFYYRFVASDLPSRGWRQIDWTLLRHAWTSPAHRWKSTVFCLGRPLRRPLKKLFFGFYK